MRAPLEKCGASVGGGACGSAFEGWRNVEEVLR